MSLLKQQRCDGQGTPDNELQRVAITGRRSELYRQKAQCLEAQDHANADDEIENTKSRQQ